MARSTILQRSTNRRKSSRLQRAVVPSSTIPPAIGDENFARARRRSSSSLSSPSDESSLHTSDDGPYRRLRSRLSSLEGLRDDDESKPAALVSSTSQQGRKRTTATRSTTTSLRSTKKKKSKEEFSLSVATQDSIEETTTSRGPLTRSRRQTLTQVTPSPAMASISPAFSFNSPRPRKKRSASFSRPAGVINLYPSKENNSELLMPCNCGQEHCSSAALSASFILSYGEEYWQHMKEKEEPIITPSSPASSVSHKSPLFASPQSTISHTSYFSHATPDNRRDYVHIDTSCLDVTQPDESIKFLHYQPELTPKMRAILVDWIIELSEHFSFGPSTLHLAVTLVDKVLACGPLSMDDELSECFSDHEDGDTKTNCFLISRERFQLLGAACTWLACKMEEQAPPNVSEIAYVSDNIYTTDQIKRMERTICSALNFSIAHQTPYPYVYEFIRASNECPNPSCQSAFSSSTVFTNLVLYLLEIGRLPYFPVTKKPSLLAAAAVYLARCTLRVRSSDTSLDPLGRWTRTLEHYTGYSKADLKEAVLAIHGYHLAAEDSSLKSVFTKYRSKKYNKVAYKTVPTLEGLGF